MKKSNVKSLIQDFHAQLLGKLNEAFKKSVEESRRSGMIRNGMSSGLATQSCYAILNEEIAGFIPSLKESLGNIPNRAANKDCDFFLQEHEDFIKRYSQGLITQVKQDFFRIQSRDKNKNDEGLKTTVERRLRQHIDTAKSKIVALKENISNRENPGWNKKHVRAAMWALKWIIPIMAPILIGWLGIHLFKSPSKPTSAQGLSLPAH